MQLRDVSQVCITCSHTMTVMICKDDKTMASYLCRYGCHTSCLQCSRIVVRLTKYVQYHASLRMLS